jgi:hypothetical protein
MNFDKDSIIFTEGEQYITGLPEKMPINGIGVAFGRVRLARAQCHNDFLTLLTCDLDSLNERQAAQLPLYSERLRRLDHISERLIPALMPRILSELEHALPRIV